MRALAWEYVTPQLLTKGTIRQHSRSLYNIRHKLTAILMQISERRDPEGNLHPIPARPITTRHTRPHTKRE